MAERWEVVVNGGGSAWALRWRRWCLFFLFVVIFFFAGGAPNAGLVAIWEDASAIGVKVCVFQTVLQLTWQADRWMVYTL